MPDFSMIPILAGIAAILVIFGIPHSGFTL
jgi:hypothetical protein